MKGVVRLLARPSAIFTCGLVLRVAVILVLLLLGVYHSPNTWESGVIASNIVNGEGFSVTWAGSPEPTSVEAPLYPYLLAATLTVFGQRTGAYLLLVLLQAVAASSMIFPIHALTRRWFGPVPATVAAWVCAFWPVYLWYSARIYSTVLAIPPHPWMLAGWLSLGAASVRFSRGPQAASQSARPSGLFPLGVGALTGLAGLTRPVLLPVYGLLSGLLLAQHVSARRWKEAAFVLAAGLVTVLVLTPWTIRNYRVHGRLLAVKDNFGKEFWMGNNPHATGTSFAEGGEVEITLQYPPRALSLAGKVPEIQIMDAFEAEAWDYVRSDRVAFVERTARKVLWFWTYVPASVARSYGRFTAAVRFAHDGAWILLLALAALGVLTRRGPWEYLAVLGFYLAVYSLAYGVTHVGQPRMRAEAEFILLPAMGAGVEFVLIQLLPRAHRAFATAVAASEPERPSQQGVSGSL
jgi:hypothetical protein